jgi:hypothetical protein
METADPDDEGGTVADTASRVRTLDGFIVTPPEIDPLTATGIMSVRYAARFDDGRGLIAFDDASPLTAHGLTRFGRALTVIEPSPDDPDTWPEWTRPKGPKRQVARGDERFILYEPVLMSAFECARMFQLCYDPRGVAVVLDGVDLLPYVLIETGPEWTLDIASVWDQVAVDCWDQGFR